MTIPGRVGSCPVPEKRDEAFQNLTADVRVLTQTVTNIARNYELGDWDQIVSLNMSDLSQYNKVCGRVIGYQVASTDGFGGGALHQNIDSYYVYGVSITHDMPRNHIWTLASGITESGGQFRIELGHNCPCSDPPSHAIQPPSFVGENYYCESGNAATSHPTWIHGHLYSGDPLWDGQQCKGQCCSNGKTPPWCTVQLPNPTSDSIEVATYLSP